MKKRYWLKGGVYGLATLAVLGLLILLFIGSEDRTFLLVSASLLFPLFGALFFAIGALIGWGYGKNRNKI